METVIRRGRPKVDVCPSGHVIAEVGRDSSYTCNACRKEKVERQQAEKQDYLTKLKLESGCKVCGYNKCARSLDFHHRNPETKAFGLSNGCTSHGWDAILDEVAKCDVICRNCHGEIHDAEPYPGSNDWF